MITLAASVTGGVETPDDGDVVEGPLLTVKGWFVIEGRPADVIEVSVDGGPPIRSRRCEPRPDVELAGIVPHGAGLAAGFTASVPICPHAASRQIDVAVTAYGESGVVWQCPPRRVTVAGSVPGGPGMALLSHPMWKDDKRLARAVPPRQGRRPRVCAMTHSLNLGGGELYLQELLVRLQADHDMDLMVVSPHDGPLRAELEATGIPVHVTLPPDVRPGPYETRVIELGSMLSKWDCDVVIVNTLGMFTFVDAARWADRPVIWAVHESFPLEVFEHLNWGRLQADVRARWLDCLRSDAHVVFEAEATKALFERQVPGIRASCISYGIDLTAIEAYERTHDRDTVRAELGFGPDDVVLMCMGVFGERKQQLALVDAFSAFVDAQPHATLVLVGSHPSPYADAVRREVDLLGVEGRIRIVDIDPDTYRYYRCADILVSASDTESLPRSFLEAMAFGVPILAADVFGVGEVVRDNVHGWLFESGSGVALLAGLRRALGTPREGVAAMSARCRASAAGFSSAGYAQRYSDLIRSCQDRGEG